MGCISSNIRVAQEPGTSEKVEVGGKSSNVSRSSRKNSLSVLDKSDPTRLTLQENLVRLEGEEDIENYYVIEKKPNRVLGTGMSGAVRQVTRKADGKVFALKTISTHSMTEESLLELQNEIDILKSLDHPHIAKLYETFEDPGVQIHLVLELCTGGELFDRLMEKKSFNEKRTAELVYNMLKALHYLHCKNIVHRDLKLENWLFRTKKDNADIMLIDFGLSATFRTSQNAEEHLHTRVGTSYYIAPEVLDGDYTSSCDMWSLGVIIFMLLSGTAPFGGDNDDQILRNVMKHSYSMEGSRWENVSADAKDFIRCLLEVDPVTRMTAEDALKHPWMTKEESTHPQVEFAPELFENLVKFKNFHELKRVAMEIVAFSLDRDEIKGLSNLFEQIDDDHNGFVTFRELKKALKGRASDKELLDIFEAVDEEHTGLIHINEFIAATLAEKNYMDEAHLKACFVKMDPLKTGFITREGLKHLLGTCVSEERAEEMLIEAEMFPHEDGDHKINFQEFMLFMKMDGNSGLHEKGGVKVPNNAASPHRPNTVPATLERSG